MQHATQFIYQNPIPFKSAMGVLLYSVLRRIIVGITRKNKEPIPVDIWSAGIKAQPILKAQSINFDRIAGYPYNIDAFLTDEYVLDASCKIDRRVKNTKHAPAEVQLWVYHKGEKARH